MRRKIGGGTFEVEIDFAYLPRIGLGGALMAALNIACLISPTVVLLT